MSSDGVFAIEYGIFVSGIGGQGVQLTAKVLASAAVAEDRYVMLNGAYGGEMRGGNSMSTVFIGDTPLRALPVAASACAAVVLHHRFWGYPGSRLQAGGLIVVDSEVAEHLGPTLEQTVVPIPANHIAQTIGNPLVAGMVLIAAFSALTDLVTRDHLSAAMRSLVPAHRSEHVAANDEALSAGAAAVQRNAHPLPFAPAATA